MNDLDLQKSQLEKASNFFLVTIISITFLGVLMVFSSSYMYARDLYNSPAYFLIRQLLYILSGVTVAVIISKTKITFWYKYAYFFTAVCMILLILTLIPGVGLEMKGARRWLSLEVITLQPGEFLKYVFIFSSIKYFENFINYNSKQKTLYGAIQLLPLLILLKQPDFGTFAISLMIILYMAFLSKLPRKYFWGAVLVGIFSTVVVCFAAPYRVKRVMTFLDPWQDPKNSGFQIIQSFLAFAHGGLSGQGLGNSHEKLFYLPEAYNDFIFSVIGEETGLIGVSLFILAFLLFTYYGFKISLSVNSRLSTMIISAITFCISFQAFLNMGVVLGLLPTKGLNLPFVSYGGSSIFANIIAIGFVFSAIKHSDSQKTFAYEESSLQPMESVRFNRALIQ